MVKHSVLVYTYMCIYIDHYDGDPHEKLLGCGGTTCPAMLGKL